MAISGDPAIDEFAVNALPLGDIQRMQEPFHTAIAAGVEMMMVGPAIVTAYDSQKASLRSKTTVDKLKTEFGFAGTVMADDLVLGSCGIDPFTGVTALDHKEAQLKNCFVEQSGQVIVAATFDKLGTVAPYFVANANDIDHLVVPEVASSSVCDAFTSLGVSVHRTVA